MTTKEPRTRQELLAARAEVRRQIEILECGPLVWRDGTPQTPVLMERLREILAEIEAELAEMP